MNVLRRRDEDRVPVRYRVRFDLRGTNLFGANLEGANLEGANLRWANLTDTKVTKEQLDAAWVLEGAIMPDGSTHD